MLLLLETILGFSWYSLYYKIEYISNNTILYLLHSSNRTDIEHTCNIVIKLLQNHYSFYNVMVRITSYWMQKCYATVIQIHSVIVVLYNICYTSILYWFHNNDTFMLSLLETILGFSWYSLYYKIEYISTNTILYLLHSSYRTDIEHTCNIVLKLLQNHYSFYNVMVYN